MDEVTYLVTLLDEYWETAVIALGSAIPAIHRVKPQIMDIRDMSSARNTTKPGRGGNRVRISAARETAGEHLRVQLLLLLLKRQELKF